MALIVSVARGLVDPMEALQIADECYDIVGLLDASDIQVGWGNRSFLLFNRDTNIFFWSC